MNVIPWDWVADRRFRIAELTAGVLCVSAPEIGPLFHKRKHGQPSASILNGNYRRGNARFTWANRGVSMLNHSERTMNNESYLELHEGHKYDVEASGESTHERPRMPGEVMLTQEIRVDSRVA